MKFLGLILLIGDEGVIGTLFERRQLQTTVTYNQYNTLL